MISGTSSVFVHIVTFNSASTIVPCLTSVLEQEGFRLGDDLRIRVTDNASSDDTAALIRRTFGPVIEVIENRNNLGFCRAHNDGISAALEAGAEYCLVLNPDLRLESSALRVFVDKLHGDALAGTATPKLLRADASLAPVEPRRFDAAGMVLTTQTRHFDRGSDTLDVGQYDRPEYVFGGTGAALLLKAEFCRDVALPLDSTRLQVFDEAFFAYREDADLAWRGQRLGWRCLYVPAAIGYHERRVLPDRRSELPAALNRFGVRNRFLLLLNNFSFRAGVGAFVPTLWRNTLVIGAVLTVERQSLSGLTELRHLWRRALKNRRAIFAKGRENPIALSARLYGESQPVIEADSTGHPIRHITAGVVNFNSGARLETCLRALVAAREELKGVVELSIVAIDNDSEDESARGLPEEIATADGVHIELSKTNLGFAGAVNAAARKEASDAVLILNPDIEISAPSILILAKTLERTKNLAAVAPRLRDLSGKVQVGFCARRLPTLATTLQELFLVHRLLPNNMWRNYLHYLDEMTIRYLEQDPPRRNVPFQPAYRPLPVEQPAGACLLVKRDAFEAVGGFDTTFHPAWFEDVDFAKRLRQAGYLCGIIASASAIHEGGYSVQQLGPGAFSRAWYTNMLRYWKKHGTSSSYRMLRVFVPLALGLRASLFWVGSAFPRRQDPRSSRDKREQARVLGSTALHFLRGNDVVAGSRE